MAPTEKKTTLSKLILWSLGLLVVYFGCAAAPWAAFVHWGPSWGLLVGFIITAPWIWAVQYRPAGINMGPFAVPILFNALGILVSWILRVL